MQYRYIFLYMLYLGYKEHNPTLPPELASPLSGAEHPLPQVRACRRTRAVELANTAPRRAFRCTFENRCLHQHSTERGRAIREAELRERYADNVPAESDTGRDEDDHPQGGHCCSHDRRADSVIPGKYSSGSIGRKQQREARRDVSNAHLKNIELKTWPSANVRSVSDPSGKLCYDASWSKYGRASRYRVLIRERKRARAT